MSQFGVKIWSEKGVANNFGWREKSRSLEQSVLLLLATCEMSKCACARVALWDGIPSRCCLNKSVIVPDKTCFSLYWSKLKMLNCLITQNPQSTNRRSNMNEKVAKKTQDSLGKIIKKPPLTDKLLTKPPFRFLHDIITSVSIGKQCGARG